MLSRLLQTAFAATTLFLGLGAVSQAAEPNAAPALVLAQYHGDRHWDDRGPRHDRRWDRREHRRADVCAPGQALRKASRLGVRGADLEHAGRRSVVVSGFKRGHPTIVRFAQARGCPVIGYR